MLYHHSSNIKKMVESNTHPSTSFSKCTASTHRQQSSSSSKAALYQHQRSSSFPNPAVVTFSEPCTTKRQSSTPSSSTLPQRGPARSSSVYPAIASTSKSIILGNVTRSESKCPCPFRNLIKRPCTNTERVETPKAPCLINRRRRHKTVHFGDNLLMQVCANAKLNYYQRGNQKKFSTHTIPPVRSKTNDAGSSLATDSKFEPNVQQLFNFIEQVLSAWVAEDGLTSQGELSEIDEKTLAKRRFKTKCQKVKRHFTIKQLVTEVSSLSERRLVGSLRYRHFHFHENVTPEDCNELFLRKVSYN